MEEHDKNIKLIPDNQVSQMILAITLCIAGILSVFAMTASGFKLESRMNCIINEISDRIEGGDLYLIQLV